MRYDGPDFDQFRIAVVSELRAQSAQLQKQNAHLERLIELLSPDVEAEQDLLLLEREAEQHDAVAVATGWEASTGNENS